MLTKRGKFVENILMFGNEICPHDDEGQVALPFGLMASKWEDFLKRFPQTLNKDILTQFG